jgi:hypothetical protein
MTAITSKIEPPAPSPLAVALDETDPPTPSPLSIVLDAAAVYVTHELGEHEMARQVCIGQIKAALDMCGEANVPQLVFELAFRLALRDQDQT